MVSNPEQETLLDIPPPFHAVQYPRLQAAVSADIPSDKALVPPQ